MILQTGGLASGLTSTRSIPSSCAFDSACSIVKHAELLAAGTDDAHLARLDAPVGACVPVRPLIPLIQTMLLGARPLAGGARAP